MWNNDRHNKQVYVGTLFIAWNNKKYTNLSLKAQNAQCRRVSLAAWSWPHEARLRHLNSILTLLVERSGQIGSGMNDAVAHLIGKHAFIIYRKIFRIV